MAKIPPDPFKRPNPRWGLWFVFILIAASAFCYCAYRVWDFKSTPFDLKAPVRINVKPGMALDGIARQLQAEGLIEYPILFTALGRLRGQEGKLQAGVYEVAPGMTPSSLLNRIVGGDALEADIRFIEGWTFRQARAALDAHDGLRHETKGLSDRELLDRLGAKEDKAEGLFFPDTYKFAVGASDILILRKSYQLMKETLRNYWEMRIPGLPFDDPYQVLTLASIVEKETGKPVDRPSIAAVFVNRLRIGMRLQSDPTVIYGIGDKFDGNLRRVDLERDTAFNTYTRNGLPPTPISLPGEASLAAVTKPPPINALYFVARGDGTSEFSKTLTEHNRAVEKYQRR